MTTPHQEAQRLALEVYFDLRRAALGLPPRPQPTTPRTSWLELVAAKEATGLSRVEAIKAAARARPDLYQAQSVPKEGRATPSATPAATSWDALVNQKVAAGLSRVEAIRAASRERPDLYK